MNYSRIYLPMDFDAIITLPCILILMKYSRRHESMDFDEILS